MESPPVAGSLLGMKGEVTMWYFWVRMRKCDREEIAFRHESYARVWEYAYDSQLCILDRGDPLPYTSGIISKEAWLARPIEGG
jgi:hypothetical protein